MHQYKWDIGFAKGCHSLSLIHGLSSRNLVSVLIYFTKGSLSIYGICFSPKVVLNYLGFLPRGTPAIPRLPCPDSTCNPVTGRMPIICHASVRTTAVRQSHRRAPNFPNSNSPPILTSLSKSTFATKDSLRSLRRIFVGGSCAKAEMQQQLYEKLSPAARIEHVYGMTETGWATGTLKDRRRDYTGSVGTPLPGTELR
jgi:hypothetical protein